MLKVILSFYFQLLLLHSPSAIRLKSVFLYILHGESFTFFFFFVYFAYYFVIIYFLFNQKMCMHAYCFGRIYCQNTLNEAFFLEKLVDR